MKVIASCKFPEFKEEDRKNMRGFLDEFERVATHAAGGGERRGDADEAEIKIRCRFFSATLLHSAKRR